MAPHGHAHFWNRRSLMVIHLGFTRLRITRYLRPIHDVHKIKALSRIVSNSLLEAPMTMKLMPSANKRQYLGLMGSLILRPLRPSHTLSRLLKLVCLLVAFIYNSLLKEISDEPA